jgi:hypothetical protein
VGHPKNINHVWVRSSKRSAMTANLQHTILRKRDKASCPRALVLKIRANVLSRKRRRRACKPNMQSTNITA